MIRAVFFATYIAIFTFPYAMSFLGVRISNPFFLFIGIPVMSTAILVGVTWLRGRQMGTNWLFVLPMIAGLTQLALIAPIYLSGGPGPSRLAIGALTASFYLRPLINILYLVSFILGARNVVPEAANPSLQARRP